MLLEPPDPGPSRALAARRVPRFRAGGDGVAPGDDVLVVEEPLELRIRGVPVATLMRTPGSDRHLALGFFLSEGWVQRIEDVGSLAVCSRAPAGENGQKDNVADLIPAEGAGVPDPVGPPRLAVATSSCGVCGKRTIEEVLASIPCGKVGGAGLRVRAHVIASLPETLRKSQAVFDATGAIHAAGLFDAEGRLHALEEDVGRHNAVDKVSGWALLARRVPLDAYVLLVSGRVSFEVVQKAFRAGVPFVAGVSGVSSLACDLARRAGITLAGFVRGPNFSIYSCPERVVA